MLSELTEVTISETRWQPFPNAGAADPGAALAAAGPVTRCVPAGIATHLTHTVRPGFPQQSQISRLLTVQHHRNSPSWSSDATELAAAHLFLENKEKGALESGGSWKLQFLFQLWTSGGTNRKWLYLERPQPKVMEQSVYYKASEPGGQDPDLGWFCRVTLP